MAVFVTMMGVFYAARRGEDRRDMVGLSGSHCVTIDGSRNCALRDRVECSWNRVE